MCAFRTDADIALYFVVCVCVRTKTLIVKNFKMSYRTYKWMERTKSEVKELTRWAFMCQTWKSSVTEQIDY